MNSHAPKGPSLIFCAALGSHKSKSKSNKTRSYRPQSNTGLTPRSLMLLKRIQNSRQS